MTYAARGIFLGPNWGVKRCGDYTASRTRMRDERVTDSAPRGGISLDLTPGHFIFEACKGFAKGLEWPFSAGQRDDCRRSVSASCLERDLVLPELSCFAQERERDLIAMTNVRRVLVFRS